MNGPSAHPLVSVVVPSYNQGAFLRATLESILTQDYRPIEVLVIDGASTDNTLDVLREYDAVPEVRWISEPDSGVVEAVNKGFAMARGEICAIQSSDDFYLPGAIRTGVEALIADPGLAFVFGDVVKVDAEGREVRRDVLRPYSLEAVLALLTWIPQPSTFFRLDLARSLGGWREETPYAADTELWLRLAFVADARKIDAFLAARREHENQRDKQGARIIRDYFRMIDALLAEQPAGRLHRAAAAGKLLQANRYGPEGSYWRRMARQWAAVLRYPPIRSAVPLGALVPGWFSVRSALARVARGTTVKRGANA